MSVYFTINNLESSFGNFKLGPLSLELDEKQYLIVLGPTGCGKTSLLRIISGVYREHKGGIYINGKQISGIAPHKRNVGYVTQTGDVFPHLTVKDNVAFGLKYLNLTHSEKKSRLDKYLDLFSLASLANQQASTLSGGEMKRTAIARSLIVEPKILLLDEPLGMLDHNGRKKMISTLKMIHDELKTLTIHVTHDRHEAWNIAQTGAIMNKGKIAQTGSVEELFRYPKTVFVADFLGGTNIFKAVFTDSKANLQWIELPIAHKTNIEKGCLLIRPELIKIVTEGSPYKTSGTITGIKDMGEYIELAVSVNERAVLVVHTSINNNKNNCFAGEKVFLDWQAESWRILAD